MATFAGTNGADSLLGGDEDDLLQGRDGADTLDGGLGIDILEGGLGDDTFIVGETRRTIDGIDGYWADEAREEVGGGIDTVVWMGLGGYRLGANIENGVAGTRFGGFIVGNDLDNHITGWDGTNDGNWLYGGGGDDTITGGDWDDTLYGEAGDDVLIGYSGDNTLSYTLDQDTLDGGAGADTMMGGQGYDTYWADDLGDVIVEVAVPAGADETEAYYYSYDTVYWTGQGAYVVPENVDIMHLRGGATEALGNDQANVIFSDYGGYDGSGELIGDAGVSVDGAGGDDSLFGGSGADHLLGGEGSDRIEGEDGRDELHGGAGDDAIHGDSTAYFSESDDVLSGDAGDDRLEGDNGDDTLDGGDGFDVLIGGWGDDVLTGGGGLDRFAGQQGDNVVTDFVDGEDRILGVFDQVTIVQDGADTVITFAPEFPGDGGTLRLLGIDAALITAEDFMVYSEGSDFADQLTGDASEDYLSGGGGDDSLAGGAGRDGEDGGDGDDSITGGQGNDLLTGGLGDDVLDGGAGGDRMAGGSGDDLYYVANSGDQVRESAGGGIDTVESAISLVLGDNVEDLVLGDAASAAARTSFAVSLDSAALRTGGAAPSLDGTGNALANRIEGSSGTNHLFGLGGDDRLLGGGGADRLAGGTGNDILAGGTGDDRLRGGLGADRLSGGDGADRMSGGAGDDVLTGGGGTDRLTGGRGADTFVFAGKDAPGADVIADFSAAAGDHIRIDAAQVHRFSDLTIRADGHGGALVTWSGGQVDVLGVAPVALSARDVLFGSASGMAFQPASPLADLHLGGSFAAMGLGHLGVGLELV